MTLQKHIIIISILLIHPLFAAQEVFDNYSIRQKAMGGTQVTALKNSTAFNQNPAFLATEESVKISFPRAEIGINSDYLDKQDTLKTLTEETNETKQLNALKKLVPMNIGLSYSTLPIFTFTAQDIGISLYSRGQIAGKLKRKTSPTLELKGSQEFVGQVGLAKNIFYKGWFFRFFCRRFNFFCTE